MEKYLIGMVGIIGMMVLWGIVQHLWRKTFLDLQSDEDVLAGRADCGSCGCSSPCRSKLSELKNKTLT